MILAIILVILGVIIEKKFSPRISIEKSVWYFHWTQKRGTRNKTKLFSI